MGVLRNWFDQFKISTIRIDDSLREKERWILPGKKDFPFVEFPYVYEPNTLKPEVLDWCKENSIKFKLIRNHDPVVGASYVKIRNVRKAILFKMRWC